VSVPEGTRTLEHGRAAYARQAWGQAFELLTAASAEEPLAAEDLERLGASAHLSGNGAAAADAWARAHHARLAEGDAPRAARAAFWIAFPLLLSRETARAGGWIARAQRLLDERGLDCVERGYFQFLTALRAIFEGDGAAARAFDESLAVGRRFADADLVAMSRNGQGRALIRMGDTAGGTALLDEVMVSVTAGEVSPLVAGGLYCNLIEACREIFDLKRAREWTAALAEWCETNGEALPFRGHCLLHRSEILQANGSWTAALDEARQATDALSRPPAHPAAGAAFQQLGELHRLRGDFVAAEEAYATAARWGREPQPGMALLWFGQGKREAAAAAVRRAVDEAKEPWTRASLLFAQNEIALSTGDLGTAESSAAALAGIAEKFSAAPLDAASHHAKGAVLLAKGHPREAASELRHACDVWRELGVPYEAARTRVALARAYDALGDVASAALEREAARAAFDALGAAPDAARAAPPPASDDDRPLTGRELQVLRLLATGRTNRAIAEDLGISEKTVARHVSNIFLKLELSSRAAATAYAYEHGLA
jgi:ATP/maltotriose-dependent transcriptional regulator MalT